MSPLIRRAALFGTVLLASLAPALVPTAIPVAGQATRAEKIAFYSTRNAVTGEMRVARRAGT